MSTRHLPVVCAWCGRVRTSVGRWEKQDPPDLDAAEATHGICPDCLRSEQFAAVLAVEYR